MKNSTKIKNLCYEQCANYDDYYKCCLKTDKECHQACSDCLVCKYFAEAVLPLDPVLHKQMTSGKVHVGEVKCKKCGNTFIPAGHHHQYCSICGPKIRKLKHRDYMRRIRSERGCA